MEGLDTFLRIVGAFAAAILFALVAYLVVVVADFITNRHKP